ncbi:hypothetical protein TCAL_08536 [Tigriopus californicus]|uniref:Cytochrome P450 n=1 Tax=Tigriopus californicus TaxID=6832 RepID=A0A553PBU6_TIGCA|nr:probable cytochrome P450 6a14 [Tigriopus californicus]TRY75154.1 hypothetical protein TCAL_08536 [Tigriopus californicus]|eukprot:TCALIF_08536-PA protein Name:"Similar to Cyp6a14 Probable cytochrome P450 6a14 (Drosophila melanogaster)" AED:0.00 eAED:0.00 QI:0/-1/0/1/-1/1/1/0/541
MFIEVMGGALALVVGVYLWFQWRMRYWADRGVPYASDVTFPVGNDFVAHKKVLLRQTNVAYVVQEQYDRFKTQPFYGAFGPFGSPSIVIIDPTLIRGILAKDFDHFVDRFGDLNPFTNNNAETFTDSIWQKQLLFLKGELWKDVRSTFSPIFTSGKMKLMMHFMKAISLKLTNEMGKSAQGKVPIDLKAIFGKFSMDTIATCAYGVDSGSFLAKDESEFVRNAKSVFTRTAKDQLKLFCSLIPGLNFICKTMKVSFFKPDEAMFFYGAISATIKHRMETQTRKNDLIDLMIDAIHANNKPVEDELKPEDSNQYDQDSRLNHKVKTGAIDELMVVATALIILVAGYDTTAMTMTYCAYQLAMNPEVQDELLAEIDEAMNNLEHGQDFPDYSTIMGMPYLDAVLQETLRIHTPIPILRRVCTKEYKIPGHNVVIPKGSNVTIPVHAIHYDDRYYSNPKEFNPKNFDVNVARQRPPYTFLSFGQGPRNCIGMRFAMLEAKVGLIAVLSRYRFQTCAQTPKDIWRASNTFLGNPNQTLWVQMEAR